jgi:hypothetical protein
MARISLDRSFWYPRVYHSASGVEKERTTTYRKRNNMSRNRKVIDAGVKEHARGQRAAHYTLTLECGHRLMEMTCPGHSDEREARESFIGKKRTCQKCCSHDCETDGCMNECGFEDGHAGRHFCDKPNHPTKPVEKMRTKGHPHAT